MLFAGVPAKAAWVGCGCVKLVQAPACVPGVGECLGMGGVCLAPCDYVAAQKVVKHHKKKIKAKNKEK